MGFAALTVIIFDRPLPVVLLLTSMGGGAALALAFVGTRETSRDAPWRKIVYFSVAAVIAVSACVVNVGDSTFASELPSSVALLAAAVAGVASRRLSRAT